MSDKKFCIKSNDKLGKLKRFNSNSRNIKIMSDSPLLSVHLLPGSPRGPALPGGGLPGLVVPEDPQAQEWRLQEIWTLRLRYGRRWVRVIIRESMESLLKVYLIFREH